MRSEVTLGRYDGEDHAARSSRRERRVWSVVFLTTATMSVEFVVGHAAHSLALTAEGWHMASHAGVLGLSGLAYWYARSRAAQRHFTFGTGKVYALAGYTNAVVLLLAALLLAVEAAKRLVHSEPIAFGEALPVAILGLLANLASIALLGGLHHPGIDHARAEPGTRRHDDVHGRRLHAHHAGSDHNLRAAYLHVLSDTLTDLLAVVALLGGRTLGLGFLDPVAGLLGGITIAYWGVGLLRSSARQLLDAVPLPVARSAICSRLEALGDVVVSDVRLWQTGPGELGCIVSLIVAAPRSLDVYRAAVHEVAPVAHLAIEVTSGQEAAQ
jgi:cation diffusion facilitator family transporter